MRAVSRITIAPMVETLPCVGGVSVTLLEAPYFDAVFRLINSIDILSMPGIHDAVQFAAKVRRCFRRKQTCKKGPYSSPATARLLTRSKACLYRPAQLHVC